MEASRNLKPATASSLRIDYNAIPENVSPFLLDKLGKNPNYYKFKRSSTTTSETVLKSFQVNFSFGWFCRATYTAYPKPLLAYRGERSIWS